VVGGGPLANPLSKNSGGGVLYGPAVALTPTGFVLVYQETNDGVTRLTAMPIDKAGGSLEPARVDLTKRCKAEVNEFTGIGLLTTEQSGQIVLARPACREPFADATFELLQLEYTGDSETGDAGVQRAAVKINTTTTVTTFKDLPGPINGGSASQPRIPVTSLKLSPGHIAARAGSGNIVAFSANGSVGAIAPFAPGRGVMTAQLGQFTTAMASDAWVAASDQVLAALAPITTDPAGGDDTGPKQALKLIVDRATTQALAFPARAPLPSPSTRMEGATWGSVSAIGRRILVVAGAPGETQLHSFEASPDVLSLTEVGTPLGIAAPPPVQQDKDATYTTSDMTIVGNRAYVALLGEGSVALHVFDTIAANPVALNSRQFSTDSRIPLVTAVRNNGHVAVAANASRVLVAWTTATEITSNDKLGGYAVFACAK